MSPRRDRLARVRRPRRRRHRGRDRSASRPATACASTGRRARSPSSDERRALRRGRAGGGHHGTIIACYLARAGLSVVSSSAPPASAEGRRASDGPGPGFRMNHCSPLDALLRPSRVPRLRSLRRGTALRLPRGQRGDGLRRRLVVRRATRPTASSTRRPAAKSGSEENIDLTYDADRALLAARRRRVPRASRSVRALLEGRLRAAPLHHSAALGQPDRTRGAARHPGRGHGARAPVHVAAAMAYDFFESPELRTLFMRAATTSTGCFPDDVPGCRASSHNLPLVLTFEPAAIAVGRDPGDHRRARLGRAQARGRVPHAHRGRPRPRRRRPCDGDPAGRRLDQIGADVVVSGLGIPQTVLRMLADAELDRGSPNGSSNIHYDRGQLWWVNVAVHEPPAVRGGGRTTPGSARNRACTGARRTPTTLATRYQAEIYLRGYAQADVRALVGRQPVGRDARAARASHIIGVEEFAAPLRLFDQTSGADVEQRFADQLLTSGGATRRT